MPTPQLTETMRRATDGLSPESSERIVQRALVVGGRRRLRHQLAVGVSSAAVLGVVATTAVLATGGGNESDRGAPVAATSNAAAPSGSPAYPTGSLTEAPGGPVIPSDRTIVADATLKQVTRELVGSDNLTGLSVEHVTGSGVGQHHADTTTDGRALSFQVDGASAWIAVGRWDGYHAVGYGSSEFRVGEGSLPDALGAPLDQRVATTAAEACGGAYQTYPAIACTKVPEGWYSVAHPNAGTAVAGARELWVDLYTDDGYVVRVHSLNTAGEKQGPRISDRTAFSEAESLAIARSSRWFTAT